MAALVETAPAVSPTIPVGAPVRQPPADRQANSIQVCLERTPTFYARIGRRMLHGSSDNKPTFDEIVITGLGMATRTAIATASILERDSQGFIKKIETSYYASTRGGPRRLPKVTVMMVKNPNAPNMDLPTPTEGKKAENFAPAPSS